MTNFRLFQNLKLNFDENGRKLSKRVENTGNRRNCSLRAISPFPTVFSKGLFPKGIKRCHCVGMGQEKIDPCEVTTCFLCECNKLSFPIVWIISFLSTVVCYKIYYAQKGLRKASFTKQLLYKK